MRKLILLATLLSGAALLTPQSADARVEHTLRYTKKQSYNAALRFLRVDSGFNIIEKDMESGYLLFEYPTEGSKKKTNGSIEVIERKSSVALIVQLPQMPRHYERMLAADLLKKLRADYGAPPKVKKPETDKSKPDSEPPAEKEKNERPEGPSDKKTP